MKFIILLIVFILAGCTPGVAPVDIYHHTSGYTGEPAKDCEVTTDDKGNLIVNPLSVLGRVPTVNIVNTDRPWDVHGVGLRTEYIPDALGSTNIRLTINKKYGYLRYAGLRVEQDATCSIWRNGIIEVDKEGIVGINKEGFWVSKRVKLDGGKIAIIMVKRK